MVSDFFFLSILVSDTPSFAFFDSILEVINEIIISKCFRNDKKNLMQPLLFLCFILLLIHDFLLQLLLCRFWNNVVIKMTRFQKMKDNILTFCLWSVVQCHALLQVISVILQPKNTFKMASAK